jgi:release factor glutamine methyltransferase
MTVAELLRRGRGCLCGNPAAGLEAEVLLAHLLGVERPWLYANRDHAVDKAPAARYLELVSRRSKGEPVAYLTGRREFWSLSFRVKPGVLIPRHETELLVETALRLIPPEQACRVADLGTGSGAIAIAVASERPRCEVHATEIDPAALAVAEENGERLAPGRVRFHVGSWFEPLEGRFDLLLSNPPYIDAGDPHLEQGDCAFEPRAALSPGRDGMAAIRQVAREAPAYLGPGGCLAFEHGCAQGPPSRVLLKELDYLNIETLKDLEGRDRVTLGFKAG